MRGVDGLDAVVVVERVRRGVGRAQLLQQPGWALDGEGDILGGYGIAVVELHPFAHVPHERGRVDLLVAGGAVHREDALADLEVQQVAKDLVDHLLVIGVEDGGIIAHVFRRLPGAVGATTSRASRRRFRDSLLLGLGLGLRSLRRSGLRRSSRGSRGSVVVVIVVAAAGEDGGRASGGHAGAGQEAAAAQLAATQSKPVVVPVSHLVPPRPP